MQDRAIFDAIDDQNLKEVAQLLEQQGANVNAANDHGNTPLHLAASHGGAQIADLLLKYGANVNVKNKITPSRPDGITPLTHAVFLAIPYRENSTVRLLLNHGACTDNLEESRDIERIFEYSDKPVKMDQHPRKEGVFYPKDYLDKNAALTTVLGILTKRKDVLKTQKMPICPDTNSIIINILRQVPKEKFATKVHEEQPSKRSCGCTIL